MLMDRFITGAGGYLPLLRFDRAVGAGSLRFSGLGGRASGNRLAPITERLIMSFIAEKVLGLPKSY